MIKSQEFILYEYILPIIFSLISYKKFLNNDLKTISLIKVKCYTKNIKCKEISMLAGDNSILQKATTAKESTYSTQIQD